jgi:hypothetical protein
MNLARRSGPVVNGSEVQTLQELRRRIAEITTFQRPRLAPYEPTGVAVFDALFPEGGSRRGMLVEFLSATEGAGAGTLGLAFARRACGDGQVLVVVDDRSWFYPPAVLSLGIELSRCLVVRPGCWQDAYAALSQSLRCRAVGGVFCWCTKIGAVDYQRLRLAAESGGGLGVLVRPLEALRSPTRASARLLVSPIASGEPVRRFHVEVLRGRGCGQALVLELDDETGDVHPPTRLAPPTAPARATRPPR